MRTIEGGNALTMPPNYKGVLFRMGPNRNRLLCYAHNSLADISFEPEIIDRYPLINYPDPALHSNIHKVLFILIS